MLNSILFSSLILIFVKFDKTSLSEIKSSSDKKLKLVENKFKSAFKDSES